MELINNINDDDMDHLSGRYESGESDDGDQFNQPAYNLFCGQKLFA